MARRLLRAVQPQPLEGARQAGPVDHRDGGAFPPLALGGPEGATGAPSASSASRSGISQCGAWPTPRSRWTAARGGRAATCCQGTTRSSSPTATVTGRGEASSRAARSWRWPSGPARSSARASSPGWPRFLHHHLRADLGRRRRQGAAQPAQQRRQGRGVGRARQGLQEVPVDLASHAGRRQQQQLVQAARPAQRQLGGDQAAQAVTDQQSGRLLQGVQTGGDRGHQLLQPLPLQRRGAVRGQVEGQAVEPGGGKGRAQRQPGGGVGAEAVQQQRTAAPRPPRRPAPPGQGAARERHRARRAGILGQGAEAPRHRRRPRLRAGPASPRPGRRAAAAPAPARRSACRSPRSSLSLVIADL